EFKGAHCFGECNKGPSIKINQKTFHSVSENNIFEILEENLMFIK
ncbi:MAG: NAD(P)H-dependent oxidoreductase subunit E, partial [Bacteroidales bacterium]|nr:NAD(P)H-dependent oxidoreductase subunit E [Bacteroidales bacterium]